ncbi:MAG: hypothetical protein NXY57DRAFT_1044750 [Lentinula lateritia]|nr:MAG: hypothetical protein NXY57DRAFT_1044750 [Lentinula lateritia]
MSSIDQGSWKSSSFSSNSEDHNRDEEREFSASSSSSSSYASSMDVDDEGTSSTTNAGSPMDVTKPMPRKTPRVTIEEVSDSGSDRYNPVLNEPHLREVNVENGGTHAPTGTSPSKSQPSCPPPPPPPPPQPSDSHLRVPRHGEVNEEQDSPLSSLPSDYKSDGAASAGRKESASNRYLLREILQLIESRVKTRYMNIFYEMTEKNQTQLTQVLAEIYSFLGELDGLDAANIHVKIDNAGLGKQWQRTKHRTHTQTSLADEVRRTVRELIRPNHEPLVSIAAWEVKEWEQKKRSGPTISNFCLQLTGLWTPWNQAAASVFAQHFVTLEGNTGYNLETVRKTFRGHLTQLRKDYNEEQSSNMTPEQMFEQRRQRAMARRERLVDRRIEAFFSAHARYGRSLDDIAAVIRGVIAEVMSGDDTEDKKANKYRITKVPWRSRELAQFLAYLSALHIASRFMRGKKYAKGAFPVARYQSAWPDSIFDADFAPPGLPENWYDFQWLTAHPECKAALNIQPPVCLTLPKDLAR